MKKVFNDFDPFLNECQIYVWEWYIPEQKVRFGIPSLNSLWLDDQEKNIKLATMLERVHPDDIQKVLVRHTSPLYRSNKMFEVDLRLNVAPELLPDGQGTGGYEWYGFRGKTQTRDRLGRPTYVRGVAINLDQRFRAQQKFINLKERQLQNARSQSEYCASVIQEVGQFIRSLAQNADSLISPDSMQDQESRLVRLSVLKDQASHILEMTDRFREFSGTDNDSSLTNDIRTLSLWEHLAELQQVYSLKAGSQLKFYFSNLYDNLQICVDMHLFDLLLDNVINAQMRSNVGGCITLSYRADEAAGLLRITINCTGDPLNGPSSSDVSSSLGLSVVRLILKRMWGDIRVETIDASHIQYVITLPLDARKSLSQDYVHLQQNDADDVLEELEREREAGHEALLRSRSSLPHVLIGMASDADLYRNQHLFDVMVTSTTDAMFEAYSQHDPDIVFVDYALAGNQPVNDLIQRIAQRSPDTPIIVTDDVAPRSLHKYVQQLGARYLLTNPLTLRKVNMMIKKYLK